MDSQTLIVLTLRKVVALLQGLLKRMEGLDETEAGVAKVAGPTPATTDPFPYKDPFETKKWLTAEVQKPEYEKMIYHPDDDKLYPLGSPKGKEKGAFIVTWCNKFVTAACKRFGCEDFGNTPDTDQAGEIVRFMSANSKKWKLLRGYGEASREARQGHLVIAGEATPNGHATGHVAVVAPDAKMDYSAKWRMNTCIVANVGQENAYDHRGVNWYFSGKPQVWLWLGDPSA